MKKLIVLLLVLALSASLLAGCSGEALAAQLITPEATAQAQTAALEIQPDILTGGVLRLKINPEIALHYDENGKVTKVDGRNPDGVQLLQNFTGYQGKETSQVMEELVQLIGQAGYFVEEADGSARKIVLELDPGSQVPHEQFLEDMALHVKQCVENRNWVGEREYDYPDPTTAPTEPAVTEPAPTQPAPATGGSRCPICYDDDCDDGKYCDDYDDREENLREAERRKNGTPCAVCGDYDCDDGKYCDDWDDRYEKDDDDDDDHRHGRHHDDDDD